MKSFIFVRGLDRSEKTQFVNELMIQLNPNPDTVRAICFAISDLVINPLSDELRAADRTIKNRVRRILNGGEERFIVIANENLIPTNWYPFIKSAIELNILEDVIGIDLTYPESLLSDREKQRLNLQQRNSGAFKADCTKYFEQELNTSPIKFYLDDILGEKTNV